MLGAPELVRPSRPRPEIVSARRRDAAIHAALGEASARCVPQLEPVIAWGRVIGHVWGDARGHGWILPWTDRSPLLYELATSLTSYSAFRGNFGKGWLVPFVKGTTGVQNGTYFDLWTIDQNPPAGAFTGSALDSRKFDDTTTGALLHGGDQSPNVKVVLAIMAVPFATNAGTVTVRMYDRVLAYEGVTIALTPTLSNTNAAQRWISAGDPGLWLSVFGQTATGATASAFSSLTYTDQDGNTGAAMPVTGSVDTIVSVAAPTGAKGARMMAPVAVGGLVPLGYTMPLAGGDIGMRAVTAYAMSAANTGTMYFLLWRPVCQLVCPANNEVAVQEQVFTGAQLPIVKDGACLAIMAMHSVNGGSYSIEGVAALTAG